MFNVDFFNSFIYSISVSVILFWICKTSFYIFFLILYEFNKLNLKKDKLNTKDSENNLLWLEQFKVKEKFEKVDRRLVINFIDEIRIGNNKEIEIDLKFKNQYNEVLDYLKRYNLWYNILYLFTYKWEEGSDFYAWK